MAEKIMEIHNFDHGWWQIIKHSWHSKLPLVAKVFIWRVLIGGLPLGLALKRHGLATGNCFFALFKWKIVLIDLYNVRFWSYISQIWQVLSQCYLTPRQWVFAQIT